MTDFLLRLPQRFLMLLILIYRYSLASIMGQRCRFAPSCSEYGLEAVRRHGAVKGGWLAARRIARCNPWGGSGYDPVPDTAHQNPVPDTAHRTPVPDLAHRKSCCSLHHDAAQIQTLPGTGTHARS